MIAGKWNYKTRQYDEYQLPDGCKIIAVNSEKIPCCQCGKIHKFGEMFTSKEIHDFIGLGYPTCKKCYKLERDRQKESKNGK
jgi:hypothetical protein